MRERTIELDGPLDLAATLSRSRIFVGDPTQRVLEGAVWCAFRAASGPVSIAYTSVTARSVVAQAFGPGAEEALEAAPDHLGARDDPAAFVTAHPVLAPLLKRHAGLRFGRTGRIVERLVPAILGQKVTGEGATRSWRDLLRIASEPAPGPLGPRLWLPPAPARLLELAYYDLHPAGVEQRRARTILEVARRARRLDALKDADPALVWSRLTALPGVGPWTAATTLGVALGDADLVPVGDYHLPHTITHAFTGEARGTDARMLELLEPFRPHRGRVVALLEAAGHAAPRFGPRLAVRDIRRQ